MNELTALKTLFWEPEVARIEKLNCGPVFQSLPPNLETLVLDDDGGNLIWKELEEMTLPILQAKAQGGVQKLRRFQFILALIGPKPQVRADFGKIAKEVGVELDLCMY